MTAPNLRPRHPESWAVVRIAVGETPEVSSRRWGTLGAAMATLQADLTTMAPVVSGEITLAELYAGYVLRAGKQDVAQFIVARESGEFLT